MTFDNEDWFPARMMLDYGDENLADLPRLEYLRRVEARIMMFLRVSHSDGIHHLDLARKVGINRKNLTPHMRRLMMKGLVVRGTGKQGKYYPSTKENRDTFVTADILGEVIPSNILEFEKCFPINSPFFNNDILDDISPLDRALLMFSNGIGAAVTYLLIQSMNPSFDIPGRDAENNEEKDINVKRWFADAISALKVNLMPLFVNYIACPLITSNNNYIKNDGTIDFIRAGEDILRQVYRSPSYMYDEKYAASLITSFSRTYPNISEYLEFVKSRLSLGAFLETNHREYEKFRYWNQKRCKHDYGLYSTKFISEKYESKIWHCRKCHKNRRITR